MREGWMNKQIDGQTDRWMDECRMGEWMEKQKKHTQENPMQPIAPHSMSASNAGKELPVGK